MPQSNVFLQDCMEGMKSFPDKYFELAIVDPPYGIGEDGSRNISRSGMRTGPKFKGGHAFVAAKNYKGFYGGDTTPASHEYFIELMRISKNQIIWGANHFISRIPIDSSAWVVWDKQNGETDFADCELAWTSFKCAVRKVTFKWSGFLQGDMKTRESRIHPTQNPVK